MRLLSAAAMAVFLCSSASAQELPTPACDRPFAPPKGANMAAMSEAQYHAAQGMWLASPPLSGLPDSDAGVLVDLGDEGGMFFLLRGKNACAYMPLPAPIFRQLKAIKNGPAGEDL